MAEGLTVLIPCKDERKNIRACLESAASVADEILVADSGSTDGTLEIVREFGGCRIIEREYVHSGDFKNWAIPQAANPWVLILDADERIPPEMAREIREIFARGPEHEGYWIYRNNYFCGHPVRYSGWATDSVLRLFRRDLGRYVGDTDHAEVALSRGSAGRLRSRLTHYTYWTLDQYQRKIERYTKWQAGVWYRQGRRPSYGKLLLSGPLRFFHSYVVRWGFLDGLVGLQLCVLTGYYSFLKQARLWELWYAIPQPDSEAAREEPVRRRAA